MHFLTNYYSVKGRFKRTIQLVYLCSIFLIFFTKSPGGNGRPHGVCPEDEPQAVAVVPVHVDVHVLAGVGAADGGRVDAAAAVGHAEPVGEALGRVGDGHRVGGANAALAGRHN